MQQEHSAVYAHMTLQRTIKKILQGLAVGFLGAICFSYITYSLQKNTLAEQEYLIKVLISGISISGLIAFVLSLVHMYSPAWSKYMLFPYAFLNGIMLFSITYLIESVVGIPGLGSQACLGTCSVVLCVTMLYTQAWLRATPTFIRTVLVASTAVFGLLLVDFVLAIFSSFNPFEQLLRGNGWLGIGFSLFMIVLYASFLLIQMTYIEQAAHSKVGKHMEWYYAFAFLSTIFGLYLRILRLLVQIYSRAQRKR